ncbi:hypothetical protein [Actinokineospora globicatena]|uniref:hypothetical protein n=1 Tax=Actinokineospora globicatena TaxID=103729 RepID=UPI0020A38B42|nr:hypothetical protein [Actinokineospora globicatena]GLW80009.1 hypothetical protein Aglo01_44900 [Actinokineospora globicatena]GLW86838.1 hypothetical protein Aglo02_44770 [Actinokineospora globicatena]
MNGDLRTRAPESFSVNGFRSLVQVKDVPISSPTIVAGHNDGGKTAFDLDEWEQTEYDLPAETRIRRVAGSEGTVLQSWTSVPADTRLIDLPQYKTTDLKSLVREFGLQPAGARMVNNVAAFREYAKANTSGEAWTPAPKWLDTRMPRLLQFDGNAENPDAAVKRHSLRDFTHGSLRAVVACCAPTIHVAAAPLRVLSQCRRARPAGLISRVGARAGQIVWLRASCDRAG